MSTKIKGYLSNGVSDGIVIEKEREGDCVKLRNFIWGALFVSMLSLTAYIKIPTPVAPVTFTVQVLLIGAIVSEDRKTPLLSVCLYLLMGILGLPVFSAGGGIAAITSPTAGFLLGYIPCVLVASVFREKREVFSALCALISLYICGVWGFVLISKFYLGGFPLPLSGIVSLFFLMFIKDLLMIFPVVMISKRIKKAVA